MEPEEDPATPHPMARLVSIASIQSANVCLVPMAMVATKSTAANIENNENPMPNSTAKSISAPYDK